MVVLPFLKKKKLFPIKSTPNFSSARHRNDGARQVVHTLSLRRIKQIARNKNYLYNNSSLQNPAGAKHSDVDEHHPTSCTAPETHLNR